jgi:hypothetical protein
MKTLNIVMVICLFTMVSCASLPFSGSNEPAMVEAPSGPADTLESMLTTKKTGYLQSVLNGILTNGQVESRSVDGKLINGEYELVVETWIVKDAGGNKHVVTIQNGILVSIDKDESDQTAMAPLGGWQH